MSEIRTVFSVSAKHPAFAGHFPGLPIAPGALLLDHLLRALRSQVNWSLDELRIDSVKFLLPVAPGATLGVYAEVNGDQLRFECRGDDDALYFKGQLHRAA